MATGGAQVAPNQSLYLQNLPEKIQKEDLKRALYMLFSTYGPVIDVVARKTPKMRGQAHILFNDVQTANQAMRGCQGYDFFGKEMRITYSKNRSDTISKLTGTFSQPAAAPTAQIAAPPASFPAPPGQAPPTTLPAPPTGLPPPPGLTTQANGQPASASPAATDAKTAQGVKRHREESEDEDAPMEEDDEDEEEEGAMEMSDDED